jgi:hypothetical protein
MLGTLATDVLGWLMPNHRHFLSAPSRVDPLDATMLRPREFRKTLDDSMAVCEPKGLASDHPASVEPKPAERRVRGTRAGAARARSQRSARVAPFLASGGLNLQIEHHLLPGANHHHLFRLAPDIQRICKKNGAPYHTYPSFRAALRAHFACMKRLGQAPAARSLEPIDPLV